MKSLDFNTNKQINIHKDYYAYHEQKESVHKLYVHPENNLPIYRRELGNGTIHFNDTLIHDVKIEISDVSGNTSTLKFNMMNSNNPVDTQYESLKMSDKDEMKQFFPPEEKNVDNDYKYSRDTYYELVEKGKQSLELMIEVARESEHPRAFEVLSGMIKNISDVNDRLMDLNKKKKDLDRKEEIKNIANTTNNLFVGSTAELQKLLKNETDLKNVTPKSK